MAMETKIFAMEKRLSEMEEKVDEIGNDVKEIKDAILGTPLTEGKGVLYRLSEAEKKVKEHDDFYKKTKWLIAVCIAAGAVIEFLVQNLWNYLSLKK